MHAHLYYGQHLGNGDLWPSEVGTAVMLRMGVVLGESGVPGHICTCSRRLRLHPARIRDDLTAEARILV